MAPKSAAVLDPAVAATEKEGRITVKFNVANINQKTVHVEHAAGEAGDPGEILVSFSTVSPVKKYEKRLFLPLALSDGKIVTDVQSKNMTMQLIKADAGAEWGTSWVKDTKKGKPKRGPDSPSHKPAAAPASPSHKPAAAPAPVEPAPEEPAEAAPAGPLIEEVVDEPAPLPNGTPLIEEVVDEPEDAKPPAATRPAEPSAASEPQPGGKSKKKTAKKEVSGEAAAAKEQAEPAPEKPAEPAAKGKAKAKKAAEPAPEKPAAKAAPSQPAPKGSAKAKAKAKAKADPSKDGAYPVMPPTDKEIQKLVRDGTQLFDKDQKKATVMLRLAARKGYLAAHLLLGQLAGKAGNEELVIEALCNLLSQGQAKKQLMPELLNQCALQLASTLRDPRHAGTVKRLAAELKEVERHWPIVRVPPSSPTQGRAAATAAKKPAAAQKSGASGGSWRDEGGDWHFEVDVPSLSSLSEGCLEISEGQISLKGVGGKVLVQEPMPAGADAHRAKAKWSQRSRRLTVVAPRAPGGSNGSAAAAGPLDGVWRDQVGELVGTIRGTALHWAGGSTATMKVHANDKFTVESGDETFEARKAADGLLVWTDGDVWLREKSAQATTAVEAATKSAGAGVPRPVAPINEMD